MEGRGVEAGRPTTVAEWLASAVLINFVAKIALEYHLGPDDAADLTQETRIALWNLGSDTIVGAALIAKIATCKAVNAIRASVRRRNRERTAAALGHQAQIDPEPTRILEVQVAALSPRLRAFFDLHYRKGLSEREIANRWHLCRASVRWLDQQCRKGLDSGGPPRLPQDRTSPRRTSTTTNLRKDS